jgi:hypothetical protein
MARPLSVKLKRDVESRALAELAFRDYRAPEEEAAYLIVEGLRRAGVLSDLDPQSDGQVKSDALPIKEYAVNGGSSTADDPPPEQKIARPTGRATRGA